MLSRSLLLSAGALILATTGLAKAELTGDMRWTFVGGHEAVRQFRLEPVADKEAPYSLTGRDSARPVSSEIRVNGSRVVGVQPARY